MQNFNDLFKGNEKEQDYLEKLVDPLKRLFGIDVFWYSTMHDTGQFNTVCSYNDAFCHFWENECYLDMAFYVSPSRLKSGYFLLDYDADYKKYVDGIQVKYPLFHPFLIIKKENDTRATLFGFASTKPMPLLPSIYVNNLPLLNSFIDYVLEDPKTEDGRLNLAKLLGHDAFYKRNYGKSSTPNLNERSAFLREIGIPKELLNAACRLTAREKEVLLACVDGKTAAQNGKELNLSVRTVQSYLENTKNKLGILSRGELLECGKLLKMGGFLDS